MKQNVNTKFGNLEAAISNVHGNQVSAKCHPEQISYCSFAKRGLICEFVMEAKLAL